MESELPVRMHAGFAAAPTAALLCIKMDRTVAADCILNRRDKVDCICHEGSLMALLFKLFKCKRSVIHHLRVTCYVQRQHNILDTYIP